MTRWLTLLALLSASLYGATVQAAAGGGLRVGAAAVDLEADDSMVLAGFIGPKHGVGQVGQLRVSVVVIEKPGQGKVAIGAVDVLFLPRDLLDRALVEVRRTTGIPPGNVLINATHTHHAPSLTTVHGYGPDAVFSKRVEAGIVKAIRQANDKLTDDARFLFHLGEERTVGGNSRLLLDDGEVTWGIGMGKPVRPTGPFDPELPVLAFKGPGDKLLGLIFNHSTHTIGTVRPNVRSPAFYGLAAQDLERELGATVCFLEGASGSTHNDVRTIPPAMAASRIKAAVADTLKAATERPVHRLVSVKRTFPFKVRTFNEAEEDAKVVRYCAKYRDFDKLSVGIFRDMRKQLAPHQGEARETFVQVILIGDVAVVGVPAEYFTSLGVDVKTRSPFEHTYVAELANDWIGYLPDREAHALGGYQTWMGQHSYAEVGTGERVADEVVSILNELKAGKP